MYRSSLLQYINSKRRSVDELGVTVEVTGTTYSFLLATGSEPTRSYERDDYSVFITSGAAFHRSTRACANQCTFVIRILCVHVFLATAPGFLNSSRTGLTALDPLKQVKEVSMLIQTVGFK